MIKAIIFDFGQTLVDSAQGFRAAEKQVQKRIYADLGVPSWDSFMSIYRGVRKEFQATSIFSRKAIWQEVYRNHCHMPNENRLESWETAYWEKVKEHTRIFPETEKVLRKLGNDYRLGLITNTQGQTTGGKHRLGAYPDLEAFFEVIIVAGEDWIPTKPDPEPFRLCLEKLDLPAHEAIYVGDDWRIDVCGSREAGLHPVWLKHHTVNRNWPDVEPDVQVIDNLEPLCDPAALIGKS
jgi:HAD superfamily hydrolase (TIGR01549 family)